jgi:hypothetical protein
VVAVSFMSGNSLDGEPFLPWVSVTVLPGRLSSQRVSEGYHQVKENQRYLSA